MALSKALLDTDILSLYIRDSTAVLSAGREYIRFFGHFSFSIVTRFEILRGLKATGAAKRIDFFNQLCQASDVINLDDDTIIAASNIYADLRRRGQIIGDADILIAATALRHGLPIVTNNESHFARITGLQIINWKR